MALAESGLRVTPRTAKVDGFVRRERTTEPPCAPGHSHISRRSLVAFLNPPLSSWRKRDAGIGSIPVAPKTVINLVEEDMTARQTDAACLLSSQLMAPSTDVGFRLFLQASILIDANSVICVHALRITPILQFMCVHASLLVSFVFLPSKWMEWTRPIIPVYPLRTLSGTTLVGGSC